jgi:hypothetical protein
MEWLHTSLHYRDDSSIRGGGERERKSKGGEEER